LIHLGLCSVTFRPKSVEEVIEIARAAGLEAIEWGGDVHVPPATPPARSKEIVEKCRKAGLALPSYGSYFNVYEHKPEDFAPVLAAAKALGNKAIRVWAGWIEANAVTPEQLKKIVATSRAIADAAAKEKIKVAFEFHNNTPTHGGDYAMKLLAAINHPNFYSYWQVLPPNDLKISLYDLEKVLPKLILVHIQSPDGDKLRPLEEFPGMWESFMGRLVKAKFDGYAYFEFNMDNSPEQLARDAAFLRQVIAKVS
jgi:3-dehydroshikimate dehydratase